MASGSTTVGALPYPVSTDAPSVHTDLQALAQALANRLTSPVSVGASQTLADGQLAVSTASPLTLTLPAAAANVKCGVFAKVATGSNPVTVSAPGGALIYGVGLNGVASLTLGAIGSFVVLQSDGTNWFIVAGQQDSGWVPLTLATNINTTSGAYTPSVRRVGDQVRFSGMATNNTGGTINFGSTIATLPSSAFAPADHVWLMGIPGGGVYDIVGGSTSIINENAISNGQFIYFDYLSYRLS